MSVADVDDTVSSSGIWRATFFCISAKPYHRRTNGLRHHAAAATSSTRSRVIGWCTVATTGRPRSAIFSKPVPRHWLSCTTSKSSRRSASSRAARRLKVLRLGEACGPGRRQFEEIDPVLISLATGCGTGRARDTGRGWAPRSAAPAGRGPRGRAARRTPRRHGRVRQARGTDDGRRPPARRNGSCSDRTTRRCAWSTHDNAQ